MGRRAQLLGIEQTDLCTEVNPVTLAGLFSRGAWGAALKGGDKGAHIEDHRFTDAAIGLTLEV